MTYWEMESEFLWGQPWNQELFIMKGRACIGFQRSCRPRTDMQVLVPGKAGDMERVILITTCHLIQGYSFKVESGQQHNLVPPNCFWEDANSPSYSNLKTDSSKGMNREILEGRAFRGYWFPMYLGRKQGKDWTEEFQYVFPWPPLLTRNKMWSSHVMVSWGKGSMCKFFSSCRPPLPLCDNPYTSLCLTCDPTWSIDTRFDLTSADGPWVPRITQDEERE